MCTRLYNIKKHTLRARHNVESTGTQLLWAKRPVTLFLFGGYYIVQLVGPNFKGGRGSKLDERVTYHK